MHFVEALLRNKIPWAQNVTLNEELVPKKWLTGNESIYKPLLEEIDDESGDIKQRAEYLHDTVYQPGHDAYLNKYHPGEIHKTWDNVHELSDDWSLPYTNKQNRIEFNNHIHSQIDFDFGDEL